MLSESDIAYEDNHLIAIAKKPGQIVQADKTGDKCLTDEVKAFLKVKYSKPGNVYAAPLHRLDRPVWGLVLYAKTSKAATRMAKQMSSKQVEKTYWAISDKRSKKDSGEIKSHLLKNRKTNIVESFQKAKDASKTAHSLYQLLSKAGDKFLYELKPVSGRSHQLRVHMAQELHCPILGDVKYGSNHKTKNRSLYLWARSLSFTHPTTKEHISILCPKPAYGFWELFQS